MTQDMLITLATLHCIRENDRNPYSEPYVWPVLMQIEQTEGIIKVSTPSFERAGVVIKASQPVGTGGGPTNVGLPSKFPTEIRQ
jgi:hypothetical protein